MQHLFLVESRKRNHLDVTKEFRKEYPALEKRGPRTPMRLRLHKKKTTYTYDLVSNKASQKNKCMYHVRRQIIPTHFFRESIPTRTVDGNLDATATAKEESFIPDV